MDCRQNGTATVSQAPNRPNASSSLLSGVSGFEYYSEACQRTVTPLEEIIRQAWYYTLRSSLNERWQNVRELYTDGGKLEAILRCFCLPCYGVARALNGRRTHSKQTGIVYFYTLLCATVVTNLFVALKNIHVATTTAETIQKSFVILIMLVAVFLMAFLFVFTYKTLQCRNSRGTLLRFFYEGGCILFGLASFGYSFALVIDYVNCGQILDANVTIVKAMFTILQALFLHYFYEARIPEDTPSIQIILAHLLGTNLSLWFWTLCSEEAGESLEGCTDYPIPLEGLDKYFTPLFVEYLLLAASLFYQMWWNDLLPREAVPQRHCPTCSCILYQNSLTEAENSENQPTNNNNATSKSRNRPRVGFFVHRNPPGLGGFAGGFFSALFLVLILMSSHSGENHQEYHISYAVGTLILYAFQICACFVIQLSLQSHQRNPERRSIDHEDILLYISIVGIILWETLHGYSLLLNDSKGAYSSKGLAVVDNVVAIIQELFQTTTLVKLRRYQRTQGQSPSWICQCVLFLLVANFTLWFQDSFFLDAVITEPGEPYTKTQHDLKPIGHIVYPLSIFFRFHSGVCFINAWSDFRSVDV